LKSNKKGDFHFWEPPLLAIVLFAKKTNSGDKKNAPPTLSWRRFVEKLRETKSGASALLFASVMSACEHAAATLGS